MPGSFRILKYTGKGAETEVMSLGLKRVDSVVAGAADGPVDDRSDVIHYQVYCPEIEGVKSYSYETWFRLSLKTEPSNQISNIRLWVDNNSEMGEWAAKIKIGHASVFRRPTNSMSDVAVNDIKNFTIDSPLLITKNGLSGYEIDGPKLNIFDFTLNVHDTGSGNKFYLNELKQQDIILSYGNIYTIINPVGDLYPFKLWEYDGVTYGDEVVAGISVTDANTVNEVVVINTTTFMDAYGSLNFKLAYGSNIKDMGGVFHFVDPEFIYPTEPVEYVVTWDSRRNVFLLDGAPFPEITFDPGRTYLFHNTVGDTQPLRLYKDATGANETKACVKGVKVYNGLTVDEMVEVNAGELFAFYGKINLFYGSANLENGGGKIAFPVTMENHSLHPVENWVGKYNIKNIDEKTDFIVIQSEVDINTTAGSYIPQINIAWDEY